MFQNNNISSEPIQPIQLLVDPTKAKQIKKPQTPIFFGHKVDHANRRLSFHADSPILVENFFDNSHRTVQIGFFNTQTTKLNSKRMSELGFELKSDDKNTFLLGHDKMCTASLRYLLINHHVTLANYDSIPRFECYMNSLIEEIFKRNLPPFILDHFFVDEQGGSADTFGSVFYFPFLDIPEVYDDLTHDSTGSHVATIHDCVKLFEEIREIVGKGKSYHKFDDFITRVKRMQKIQDLKDDPFYVICHNRREKIVVLREPITKENRKLGSGGFGDVYEAKNGNEIIAVKRCKERTATEDNKLKAEQEYLMGIALKDQPNVVQFLGKANDATNPRVPLIVMKYYPTTLEKMVADLPKSSRNEKHVLIEVNFEQSLIQMIDIITGALHLISMNILHRDYKAENIFVDEKQRCFIGDIGSSVALGLGREGQTMIYTQQYISPDASQNVDKSLNDIFALALTLANFFVPEPLSQKITSAHNLSRHLIIREMIDSVLPYMPENIQKFAKQMEDIFDKFLKCHYYERSGWLEMIHLKRFLVDTLKKECNVDYVPIQSKYPIQTVESVIKQGLNWIERKVKYNFFPQFDSYFTIKSRIETYKSVQEKKIEIDAMKQNGMQIDEDEEIMLFNKQLIHEYFNMLQGYALYCSEENKYEDLKKVASLLQCFITLHLLRFDTPEGRSEKETEEESQRACDEIDRKKKEVEFMMTTIFERIAELGELEKKKKMI